jgi:hypothetical protein
VAADIFAHCHAHATGFEESRRETYRLCKDVPEILEVVARSRSQRDSSMTERTSRIPCEEPLFPSVRTETLAVSLVRVICNVRESPMTRLQEKARAQTKRIIGQMVGDEQLVREGMEEQRRAETNDDADQTEEHQKDSD